MTYTSEQLATILAEAEKGEFNQHLLTKYYNGEYTWAEVKSLWKN